MLVGKPSGLYWPGQSPIMGIGSTAEQSPWAGKRWSFREKEEDVLRAHLRHFTPTVLVTGIRIPACDADLLPMNVP